MAISALREQPQWISVMEKLPEEWTSVIGCCPDVAPMPTVREVYLCENGNWHGAMIYGATTVTYWMPMPEPPKEKEVTQ